MNKLLLVVLMLVAHITFAQETFPVNGVKDERPGRYALVKATVFVDYQTKIENATLLINNGKVERVGAGLNVPTGYTTIDLEGKYIYPAIVEPYATYGVPEAQAKKGKDGPQYTSDRKGPYGWNDAIQSTYQAVAEFAPNNDKADELRKVGVGAVNAYRANGLMRGNSVVATLANLPAQEVVIKDKGAAHFSFNTGTSQQAYPNSIMGKVALLRQTYYDARWYQNQSEQVNLSLEGFNDAQDLPQVFEANGGKLRVLLADKVGDEFGVQYIIKGNGDEYQRLNEIKQTNARLILPLDFPDAYDVTDPLDALDVSLADMKHWELAPANPAMLANAGVEFALTLEGLKDRSAFWKNLRKAVSYGLAEEQALKALTETPAKMFRVEDQVGSLESGRLANFFVADQSIFEEDATIEQTWVQGIQHEYKKPVAPNYAGAYDLNVGEMALKMEISGDPGKHNAKLVINDTTDVKIKASFSETQVALVFELEESEGETRLSGWITENGFEGNGNTPEGDWVKWTATRTGDLDSDENSEDEDSDSSSEKPELGKVIFPFVAYGWSEAPIQESILFKNATVWTLEGEGKMEESDVLVSGGKVAAVGKGLESADAKVIDATGMHLTPGIIDEHSHIALSSVNEGSHAITAEVRMYDAVDSEDIDMYRQLAGGVTAAQLLHGSANPVGGQSALVKFRWGASPEELKIEGADGFIKFALGENVKQSNWGSDYRTRFPQTRMGVEQVYMDGFTRAKAYGAAKAKYEGLSKKAKANAKAPRVDLQLETLLEIINKDRFITCHSYVQSEINMLMKVAEKFGFRVNTFTHILEGYKVADKMAAHGAGGSTFADWWAYKFEVKDAIPYNASLMSMAGVVSAINSDDGEMARRLNQEAAKSIKYGGMSEVEALKLVTLNPAKLLHLDDRMGSIKVGKDADLVLWDTHPLSIYAQAQLTLVDGKVMFSRERDAQLREEIAAERARLIAKMIAEKNGGAKTQKPKKKEKHYFECEDIIHSQIH